ncbi:MAG: hypothetical protein F6K01_03690 [Okeania sp. SIO1I7]|nr:hypothetical protein [Okeania sp. SIO1I7]
MVLVRLIQQLMINHYFSLKSSELTIDRDKPVNQFHNYLPLHIKLL